MKDGSEIKESRWNKPLLYISICTQHITRGLGKNSELISEQYEWPKSPLARVNGAGKASSNEYLDNVGPRYQRE